MNSHASKLKIILEYLNKIERLQSKIRKIVPRKTAQDIEDDSIKEITFIVAPSTARRSDCKFFDTTDNVAKEILILVDAFVQTSKEREIYHEPFDILNYIEHPNRLEKNIIISLERKGSKLRKRSDDKATNLSGTNFLTSGSQESKELPMKEKTCTTKRIVMRLRGAAAAAREAPAGTANQRQQVHASTMKLETEDPRLQTRSQGTRDDRRDEKVRVPVSKHRTSWMTIKWVYVLIGLQLRLARMLSDRRGSELDQQQKQIKLVQDEEQIQQHKWTKKLDEEGKYQERLKTIRWLQHVRRKLLSITRESNDCNQMEEKRDFKKKIQPPEEHGKLVKPKHRGLMQQQELNVNHNRSANHRRTRFRLGRKDRDDEETKRKRKLEPCSLQSKRNSNEFGRKTKKLGLSGFFDCLRRISDRSSRAEIVVPYHYPGDRTPRLVETASIFPLDDAAETLRVISSAVKVSIKRRR